MLYLDRIGYNGLRFDVEVKISGLALDGDIMWNMGRYGIFPGLLPYLFDVEIILLAELMWSQLVVNG